MGILGGIEIRVLGTLRLARRDAPLETIAVGPAQRRLLAALAANAGQVVSAERLADMLGLNSTGAIRTTVHRIRAVAEDLIEHEAPGYVVRAERLDSHQFIERLAVARQTGHSAVALYDEALSLWRGPAFAECASQQWALAESTRLDELRTTARAERIQALLLDGRVADAVADAEQLIHDEPLREKPRSLHMCALAMQGRQTEALRAFQNYRCFLANEAGVEPSAELAAIEARILSGEISPTPTAAATPRSKRPAPTGTVTFLAADIESSTPQRKATDAAKKLRACAEQNGGFLSPVAARE